MSTVIGKPINRVDGRLKVTGKAQYSAEIPLDGIVHAVLVGSAIAKGRIEQIDTSAAKSAPGVLAVLTHLNIPKVAKQPTLSTSGTGGSASGQSFAPMQGPEIYYCGQHIGIVVADTLEHAEHAATLFKVSYHEEKPIARIHQALADVYNPEIIAGKCGNARPTAASPSDRVYQPQTILAGFMPAHTVRGNPVQALADAPVSIYETYTMPMEHHNPLEPGATTAVWEGDELTLYDATQGVFATQLTVAEMLGLPPEKVRVITQFVGGSFGCKAMVWSHPWLAALAARYVDRPVKLVLSRPQMYTSCGHREEQVQQIALGATEDGRLTAIAHVKMSGTSPFDDWAEPSCSVSSMMYQCPNYEGTYQLVRLNTMTPTFTRGPGETSGAFALECALDELAYKLGLDPIELRLRNYAEVDPASGEPWSSNALKECYARGAELFGWSRRNPEPRSMREGRYLIGYGMASATYPVYQPMQPQAAHARLYADGHAVVGSGTQDFGTGTYTVMTQVAADALGLPMEFVRFKLGDTNLPNAVASVGSQGAGAHSSAVHAAATALRCKIIGMVIQDEKSPLYSTQEEAIAVENGRLFLKEDTSKGETYSEILTRLHLADVEATGTWTPPQVDMQTGSLVTEDGKRFSMHSFGAQFVEVRVDLEIARVRVQRMVGAFGAGRILNQKTARSQILGGMIWGLGQALLEETHMDERYGRYINANLGEYHVPVNADAPKVTVEFVEEQDPYINALGVKGIGEVGMVGAAPAIANAIFHATGKRIRELPISPDKLL